MQRKKLIALPIPAMTTTIELPPACIKGEGNWDNHYNYFYTAQIDSSTGEDVLIIDLYATDGVHKWRYYINKSEQYFRLMSEGKLSNAGMDHVLDWSMRCRSTRLCEPETTTIIAQFFGEHDLGDPFDYLAKCNRENKEKRLETRLNKIRKRLDDAMTEITPLPVAVSEWVDTVLLKSSRYMVYKYAPKKQVAARCTYCGTTSTIDRPKHLHEGVCPHCKSEVTYLASGMLHGYTVRSDTADFAYVQPTIDGFCIRGYTTTRYFRGPVSGLALTKVETENHEWKRIFYSYDAQKKQYKEVESYVYEQFRGQYERRFCVGDGYMPDCSIYPHNLNALLKRDGQYPHLDFDGIARDCGKMRLDELIYAAKHPALENLYKSKLYATVSDIVQGDRKSKWLDLTQTSAKKALSLSIDDVELAARLNLSLPQLSLYHEVLEKEGKVDVEAFTRIAAMGASPAAVTGVLRHCTLHGIARYLGKQVQHYNTDWVLDLWSDYLLFAAQLGAEYGYDLKNHNVLYPRDLQAAHDRAAADKVKHREKILQKKHAHIAELYTPYMERYGYSHKGLMVRPPRDYAELKAEGAKLHHCVAAYAERVAVGVTIILFVRKAKSPDKPYFTLEINPQTLEMCQCRGLSNCDYGADVKSFLEVYLKELILIPSKKTLQISSHKTA